eukprot:TRINITY_DN3480_c0_g1_i4.p1 TRINITY_DN3480_c0_g1~~TRINITY_DN3480_c0_g1_i4.p1  ORF type:complete len:254 (-),score=32.76 TRINITY_DN3480_c0_g1_i4:274-1035(-)
MRSNEPPGWCCSGKEEMSNLFPTQSSWVEEFNQISYGLHHDQSLDVYRPPVREPVPTVVFVHGGAWIRKNQRQNSAARLARQLVVQANVCVVVVGYRVSSVSGARFAMLSLIFAAIVSTMVFASLTTTAVKVLSSTAMAQSAALCSLCAISLAAAVYWFAKLRGPEVKFPEHPEDVLTAQHELAGLQTQADEFVDELEAVGCWVQQLCVPGTNHGTIMSGISNPVDAKCKHPVVEALSKFILTTVVDRKMCML